MPDLTCPTCQSGLQQHRTGPCLDAWVARALGCTVGPVPSGASKGWICECPEHPHGGRDGRLRAFSTEWTAAALVLESLRARGWEVTLSVAPEKAVSIGLTWTRHDTLADDVRAHNCHPQATGATGLLALARGAILAHGAPAETSPGATQGQVIGT